MSLAHYLSVTHFLNLSPSLANHHPSHTYTHTSSSLSLLSLTLSISPSHTYTLSLSLSYTHTPSLSISLTPLPPPTHTHTYTSSSLSLSPLLSLSLSRNLDLIFFLRWLCGLSRFGAAARSSPCPTASQLGKQTKKLVFFVLQICCYLSWQICCN